MSRTSTRELNARIQMKSAFLKDIIAETGRVLVGQETLVNRMLIGLLCNGHLLIEGVPGLAKTLAVRTLANTLNSDFQRIQFTPDLLPADLIGTQVYRPDTNEFKPRLGPVFANIVLADEINRAPAKVQSALLEAMEEKQVTIGDYTYDLPQVFMVLATQNPIEQQGTYPLPEAQLDRFMMKVIITYPSRTEEEEIMERMGQSSQPKARPVATVDKVLEAREHVDQIYVDSQIKRYMLDIVFATREPANYKMDDLVPLIEMGASPRATLSLLKASRALAFIKGRGYVIPMDVKTVASDVMRHRLALTFEAEAQQFTTTRIVEEVLKRIPVP